jgi:hypothetical protein
VLFLLSCAVAGAALGAFGAKHFLDWMLPVPGSRWLKVLLVPALPAAWLLAAGLHELGHVVGGWLGGGRFMLWVAGPFMVRRTPAGIRFAWNRSVNVGGGMALCAPLDPRHVTPRRVAMMVLGGPVASLLVALAAFALAAWMKGVWAGAAAPAALCQNLMVSIALLSFFIFLMTSVPAIIGGFKSDGRRVFDLIRGGPRSEQEAALLLLSTAGLGGTRPADYDPKLVQTAVSLGDGSLFDLYGHLTVYYFAADRGDWAQAQTRLDRVAAGEEKMAPYMRDVLRCEYAWLLAGRVPDVSVARAWLDSAGPLDFEPATRLRAEAAVLLAEGKLQAAATRAREGLKALETRSLSPVKSAFAEEALQSILRASGALCGGGPESSLG